MPDTDVEIELTPTRHASRVCLRVSAPLAGLPVDRGSVSSNMRCATFTEADSPPMLLEHEATTSRINEVELAPVDTGYGAWSFVRPEV